MEAVMCQPTDPTPETPTARFPLSADRPTP